MTEEIASRNAKVSKVPASEHKGYRLGTTNATWKKIKLTAKNGSEECQPYNSNTVIKLGPNGEVFILHRKERILELWTLQDESLQIIAQLTVAGTQDPQNVHILDRDNDYYLIVVEYEGRFQLELYPYNFSPGKQLETTEMQFQQLYTLTDIFYDKSALRAPEIIIKGNKDYIIFASSHGWMHVAKRIPDQFNYEFITPVMKPNIYKNASEIYHHEGCDNLLFKTSCFDNQPIFDVVGKWLVYSPTKQEHKFTRVVNDTLNDKDSVSTAPENLLEDLTQIQMIPHNTQGLDKSNSTQSKYLTQVKLPPPGPLLNRVISSLLNTAIDSISKLSEAGLSKVKAYWKGKHSDEDMVQYLQKLGRKLYSSALSTAQLFLPRADDNQLIKIIDLSSDKVMAVFRPPGGVLNVLLSPYDLQLVHVNMRGDTLLMWDLFRLPREVSLIGKFARGKTSATISDIFWSITTINSTGENNYGFGCTTKNTGLIHWFNVNYLLGSQNSNFPNSMKHLSKRRIGFKVELSSGIKKPSVNSLFTSVKSPNRQDDDFCDAWILSSLRALKFMALPDPRTGLLNQLAVLNAKNQIRLISPINGHTKYKFQLAQSVCKGGLRNEVVEKTSRTAKPVDTTPLSGAEIETCGPYPNLYKNKNIVIRKYQSLDDRSDVEMFLESFECFGNQLSQQTVKFASSDSYIEENVTEGVELDQEQHE